MGVLGINHIAFRSPDPAALRAFYTELTGAEPLEGEHDREGFESVLERARALCVIERGPVEHSPWSRGLYARDPDGRRLEFTYDDRSVYWR